MYLILFMVQFKLNCLKKICNQYIFKNYKYIDWYNISKIPILSENTIRTYRHLVDWNNICRYQKLSENNKVLGNKRAHDHKLP